MTNDQEGEKRLINNNESLIGKDSQINRGFELMLRHRSRREKKPESKSFGIMINKVISILKREINFRFEISFKKTKKQ